MANLDAIYRVIHQPSGTVVEDYGSEKSALACVERENEEYPDSHVVVKYVRADLAHAAPVAVPEGYSEEEIADAFITVGVWDNKFEAFMDCLRASRRAMLAAAKGKGNE